MSEVDASIPLGVRPVQFDNPMDVRAKALQLSQLGLANQSAQQDYADNQTMRAFYRKNVGADGTVDQPGLIRDLNAAGLGKQAIAMQQQQLTNTKTRADIGETLAKTDQASSITADNKFGLQQKKLADVGNRISSLLSKPDLSRQDVIDQVNQLTDQHSLEPAARDQMLATIPQEPSQLRDFLVRKGLETQNISQQLAARSALAPRPVYEDTGAQKVGIDTNPLTNGGKLPTLQKSMTPDEAAKIRLQTSGALTDDAKSFMIDRLLNGEKASAVLGNLGRGQQGAADLRDVMNRLPQVAAQRGIGGAQIANIMQNTAADARTLTELGAREGKIAPRVQEAQNFAEVAKAASAAVPRGSFVPWNRLSQAADSSLSDPALAKLKAATNSLINAYAAAVGGGSPTVHDKEAAEHMLSTAQSPEAYNAVVDQLILETQKALDAPGQVRARLNAGAGRTEPTPTGPAVPADIAALLKKHGGT